VGGEGGGTSLSDGKPLVHAMYVAPLEPLVLERYVNWKEKLGEGLGIKIAKLTGALSWFEVESVVRLLGVVLEGCLIWKEKLEGGLGIKIAMLTGGLSWFEVEVTWVRGVVLLLGVVLERS
jgi:hypothetical protein